MSRSSTGLCIVACGVISLGGSSLAAKPSGDPERVATTRLQNVVRVNGRVLSGASPDGEPAFAELASLGVRTVVSVDGAPPDVETARRFGLRYVHLPHGYDGVPTDVAQRLACAVSELDAPVYIHCHHGKHRSPAAAAVACVGAGTLDPGIAESVLRVAGTSPTYAGLFRAARNAERFDAASLAAIDATLLPERAATPPLVESMVALEHAYDRLVALAGDGWRAATDRADDDAAHAALLLREHFAELRRLEDTAQRPAEYQRLLERSEALADRLERGLRAWRATGAEAPPPELARHLSSVAAACGACHRAYRDRPRPPGEP